MTDSTRMKTATFGRAHPKSPLEGEALEAWAADRRAAWAFMREQDAKLNSAGFPQQVDGVWTVRYIDWSN